MVIPKTICFLLPDRLDHPVGGHIVVYHYANNLDSRGYSVIVANNIFRPSECNQLKEFARMVFSFARYLKKVVTNRNTCRSWFPLKPSIKEISVWSFRNKYIPSCDFYVATNAMTAPYLMEYPVPDSHKFYLIQGYETWLVGLRKLIWTYQLPVVKVAVAKWLAGEVTKFGKDCIVIPNGYNDVNYYVNIPIPQNNKYSVSMLYHNMETKNCKMAFQAFDIVKSHIPELTVVLFGVPPCPENLPEWYEYHRNPDLILHNRINNESAAYVDPSSSEGFCLTILESMACGQAVACTDIPGYREVAINEDSALVSAVDDAKALADNVIRLINDDSLRIRIAYSGLQSVAGHSMDAAAAKFSSLFESCC